MNNLRPGAADLDWQRSLRRAALSASPGPNRGLVLAALAALASLAFLSFVAVWSGSADRSSGGLENVRQLVARGQQLANASLPADSVQPIAYPLWLLLVARFSGDVQSAARVLSALSAVLSLFLAYQLCHTLSDSEKANEQSLFSLLSLALSSTFFLAAADAGSEMPHLALVLWGLLCIQRALSGASPFTSMMIAGLILGLSAMIRPISLVALPAVVLWLAIGRPFRQDEPRSNLRPGVGFSAAFLVGSAPLLIFNTLQHSPTLYWGLPELLMLGKRLLAEPLVVLVAAGGSLAQYLAADDIQRVSAVGGSWQAGDWSSSFGAIIALAPTILKVVGLAGIVCLCWLERMEGLTARGRLLAMVLILFAVSAALGLVEERSLLLLGTILVIFAFAGLPSLLSAEVAGGISLALVGGMLMHQVTGGYPVRPAPEFRASDQVAATLRGAGARPDQVMSANWMFYDTASPWRERYRHLPVYVDGPESLLTEMKRQGTTYLVFDRQTGAEQWPALAGLMDAERPRDGLRSIHAPIRTDQSPPNLIAIYKLE